LCSGSLRLVPFQDGSCSERTRLGRGGARGRGSVRRLLPRRESKRVGEVHQKKSFRACGACVFAFPHLSVQARQMLQTQKSRSSPGLFLMECGGFDQQVEPEGVEPSSRYGTGCAFYMFSL